MEESLTIELTTPIIGPAGEVAKITIHEPTAAEMALWDGTEGTVAQIKALSVCAAQPVSVIEKMKARDFLKAVRHVESFLA